MPTGRALARRRSWVLSGQVVLVAATAVSIAAIDDAASRWAVAALAIVAALVFAVAALAALRRAELRPLEVLSSAADAVQSSTNRSLGTSDGAAPGEVTRAVRDSIETADDAETTAREAVQQGTILAVQLRSELSRDLSGEVEGWTVATGLRPAEGLVAGDCYDVGPLGAGKLGILVLDIAGHGALTAVAAVRCRDLLKAGLRSGMAPGQAFGWLLAQDQGLAGTFLTGFVAVVDTGTGAVQYANAGHPEAMVRDGATLELLGPTGPIVGPVATEWRTALAQVPLGGALAVYTDGLIEARDDQRRFYGVERLHDLVRRLDCSQAQPFVDEVLRDLDRFQPARVADDVTLVVACRGLSGGVTIEAAPQWERERR